jgi:hypothetical protein
MENNDTELLKRNFDLCEKNFSTNPNKGTATKLAEARKKLDDFNKENKDTTTVKKTVSQTIYHLNSKMNFGRFKDDDLTVEEVIDCDREYITWSIENIEWFVLSSEAYKYYVSKIK